MADVGAHREHRSSSPPSRDAGCWVDAVLPDSVSDSQALRYVTFPTSAQLQRLIPVSLPANGFASAWFGKDGIPAPLGLAIDWKAGAFDVSIYYKKANY